MLRLRVWFVILFLLVLPSTAGSDILNLRSGFSTVLHHDRDTQDSIRYGSVLFASSYRTPTLDLVLDLPLRWDIETSDFDKNIWKREGDLLRPLKQLRYSSANGQVSGGFEVFTGWTPGLGFLVRDLSGMGEIDYILPGLRFRWSGRNFDLDAGMDRPVNPTVQAAAIKWRVLKGVTLVLEGAVDPDAPEVFTGNSSGGRPRSDNDQRLTAQAAGVRFDLLEGDFLDLGIGVHAGSINGDAKGMGSELTATLDFSRNYLSRLKLLVRSVGCEGGYVPAWFDAIYPMNRWGQTDQPFLYLNPLDSSVPDRTMLIYDIEYDLGDYFSISGGLDVFRDDSMKRARFEAQLKEDNGRGLELSIWSRADDPDVNLFSEDSNLYSRVSALYNFLPHFLLNVSYEHSWAFREEEAAFKPLNSVLLGVMYDISF